MKAQLANHIVLDLGSSKIVALAAYVDNVGETRILSQHLSASEGIQSGIISDLTKAENSVTHSVYAVERDCNKSVQNAVISLSGTSTKSHYIYHKSNISNSTINRADVQNLIYTALDEFRVDDYEIIHFFPIEFTLDGHHNVQDPVGMIGNELGVRLHVIMAHSNTLLNIANCVSKCHVEVAGVVLAIYASGIACLTEDEQNLGSVIIDIGARTTSYGIFCGKKLLYASHIPIGGWHITSDIAKAFSLDMYIAEKLKVLYGGAVEVSHDKHHTINIEDMGYVSDNIDSPMITTSLLSQVINPRVEEILELVKADYDKIGVDHLIARRIVLTGGASMMRGIKECAAKIFEKQVRLGQPIIFPGFAEDHNPYVYSVAVGMVKIHATANQMHSLHMQPKNEQSMLSKVLSWLKNNI